MNNRILLIGSSSKICQELIPLLPVNYEVIPKTSKDCDFNNWDDVLNFDRTALHTSDRIVFTHGIVSSKGRYIDRSPQSIEEEIKINLLSTVHLIESALTYNSKVRIVVLGSESGKKGSFDIPYALSKFSLHKYVEERRINYPGQQLVCIAPSLIVDSGMTSKRIDIENIKNSIETNPKKRGVKSIEVARLVHYLLFVDEGYINSTVVHMNGGKFARM